MSHNLSINITIHKEGEQLISCFQSVIENIKKLLESYSKNIEVETNLIIDDSDDLTKEICKNYSEKYNFNLYFLKSNDLGNNKNFAVSISKYEIISFVDGDDIWGTNWLKNSYTQLKYNHKLVLHPELVIYFGENTKIFICENLCRKNSKRLEIENLWISSLITHKTILENFHFKKRSELKRGEFEDWEWNKTSLKGGIEHKVVNNTVHFVRDKIDSYSKKVIYDWE